MTEINAADERMENALSHLDKATTNENDVEVFYGIQAICYAIQGLGIRLEQVFEQLNQGRAIITYPEEK